MEMKKQEQTILEERNQRLRLEQALNGKHVAQEFFFYSKYVSRSSQQAGWHRGQGEEGGGQREGEQERPGPADQPHQECGESGQI